MTTSKALLLVVALCLVVLAECKPSGENQAHRVARQVPNPIGMGITVASQMADAARSAASMGMQAAQGMAQAGMSAMSKIPGMGQG